MSAPLRPQSICERSLALVNPKAANAAAHSECLRTFEDAGGAVSADSGQGQLDEVLRRADVEHRNRLIVVGGDGSISCLINALGPRLADYEIAVVPAGTGNDFARSLDLPLEDPQQSWEMAVHGASVAVDLIRVNGAQPKYFINTITAGFGGKQASSVAKDDKPYWGKIAYWAAAAAQLGDMPEYDVSFRSSERTETLRCFGFWLANGRYVGGGFPVAPEALIDDGMLDVVAVPSMATLDLLAAGIDFTLAGPEQSDYLLTFRAAEIAVAMTPDMPLSIDGEPAISGHVECHVLRHALRIIAGNVDPASGSGVAANEK